jgi:KDO2-lipid IV(A) lauroyltransferase
MAKRQKAKWLVYLEFITARTIIFFLSILPRTVALALGKMVAWAGYYTLGNLRRTGLRNLEIAFPELSENERLAILKGSLQSLGRVLGEVSQFDKATPESLRKIVDFELDEESKVLYKRVREEKRGVVITTGHLGNWELLVFAFAALHEPIAYLARPLDNPLIEELTVKIRTRFGNRPINKANSAMLVIRMLRDGEIVGIFVGR